MDELRQNIPFITVPGMILFPQTVSQFHINAASDIDSIKLAMSKFDSQFFCAIKNDNGSLSEIGTVCKIRQTTSLDGGFSRVLCEGSYRARCVGMANNIAAVENVDAEFENDDLLPPKKEAMKRHLLEMFEKYVELNPQFGQPLLQKVNSIASLSFLIDQICINIPLGNHIRRQILEERDKSKRYEVLSTALFNEIEVSSYKHEFVDKIREKVDLNQKNYILREQLEYIRKELGLGESDAGEIALEWEEKLTKITASEEVLEHIGKEIKRFKTIPVASPESSLMRTYIETLFELPWNSLSEDSKDLKSVADIMDNAHYGMEKVKERVLELLAVRMLNPKGDSPVICLVGPPGTGKTSIARSIAKALHKEYVRVSLGGVRDEAEIRGHRRTYIGAMPGRIVVGLKTAKVANPLMLLDELDKVSSDYKGDVGSALLEVLDHEVNAKFHDHYVEVPIDLSNVFFIATANTTSTISKPLLDRMELIEVSGYTANEKFHIAKNHLLGKQMDKSGLKKKNFNLSDGAIRDLIKFYTRESGVRELERQISRLCQKSARRIVEGDTQAVRLGQKDLVHLLGKHKFRDESKPGENMVGVVRGLAYTAVGGTTLSVEVNTMPGKGELKLTGQLGDVMKESAAAALSFIRSIAAKNGVEEDYFSKTDFHLHVPEGAVPKDGPSAGVTIATALLSAVTLMPVRSDVAMTGEITLRGRVLPIGGLKEKLLAAKMAHIATVLVPAENEKDLDEISDEIKGGMEIIYAKEMRDVFRVAVLNYH